MIHTNPHTVLLLGAGHSEFPLAKCLKQEFGYKIISTGNALHGLTAQYIDEHVDADYSNQNLCARIFNEKECNFALAGCNDFAEITRCFIMNKIGAMTSNRFSLANKIHHKDRLIQDLLSHLNIDRFAISFNSGNPEIAYAHLKKYNLEFPFIVKPTDLSGGKGMSIIHETNQLSEAISRAKTQTRRSNLILEKYFEGSNHAMTMLFDKNGFVFYFVDSEQHDLSPFSVSGASSVSNLNKDSIKDILQMNLQIWENLKLGPGLLHTQFINTKEGLLILEITQRCPGDLYPLLVQYATNWPYIREFISLSLHNKLSDNYLQKSQDQNYILRQCVYKTSIESHMPPMQLYSNKYTPFESFDIKKENTCNQSSNSLVRIDFYKQRNLQEFQKLISYSQNLCKPS